MKHFKTFLKYFGYLLIGLVIAGALLPYVFKGKLMTYLKENINKNVHADVDFTDADLSFFSSFPDIRIQIDSLKVSGLDEFDGIVLYKADKTNLDISLPSLMGDNIPKINSVDLIHPEINIIVLDSIQANYNISNDTSTTESKYSLQLDKYNIQNGKITYQDNPMQLFVIMENVNHSGSGDFTQDIFDLKTNTTVEKFSMKYEGTSYLKNANVDMRANFNINFPESKYKILDNTLSINDLDLKGEGFVQLKGDDILTDLSFMTSSESFKSLLSMLPNAYTADFKDVKTQGTASIKGIVKGTYNGSKNMMPGFSIDIKVADGYVKYPTMPMDVKDIFADIHVKALRPDYKDMNVNIPAFKLKIGNDPISGKLVASNLTGDQNVEGFMKGALNLGHLMSVFPIQDVDELNGLLQCDMSFKAKMSDVNAENYKAISFDGNAKGQNIKYRSKGMPVIQIANAQANASPEVIVFDAQNMQLGKSDLQLAATLKNPLAFLSTEKNVNIDINGQSNLLDMNEWMTNSTEPTSTSEQAPMMVDDQMIRNSSVNMKWDGKKVLMNDYQFDNMKVDGQLAANAININQFSTTIKGSDIHVNGVIANAMDYFFGKGILDGKINFTSNNFDANQFMVAETTSSSAAPMTVIPVPENVRLKMQTHVKNLTYTNLQMRDFTCNMSVIDQEVSIKDMKTNTLGGTIGMEGLYSTKDIKAPDFAMKLDLSKIKYVEAVKKIDMLKKAAPIAEYLDGIFNTSLVMKGKLGNEMTPDLSTLDASGFLETINGTLKGYNPLLKLSDMLGLKEIKEVNFLNTKNWFEILQGFIELKEYNKVIKGIDMTISGKHGFGKEMNYNIDLVIPREMMKKNKITGAAESGLSLLESEASKIGLDINQGPNIFLNVKMTGSLKDPKFKITPKSGRGTTVTDAVGAQVNNAVATAKDSINKELKKKEAEIRDTVTKRVNQEIEKAKSKAEEAAQKTLDSLKRKAQTGVVNKIDTLTKGVISDSLKQKAKDVIGSKGQEEVDKIKDKLKDFNPFKKKKG